MKGEKTMLDYEVFNYTLQITISVNGQIFYSNRIFHVEEDAVEYIKLHRHKWNKYRLIKHETAIIYF